MGKIFELIIELVLNGCFKVSKNKKIPKYIRYPLIAIISLFFIAIIELIFIVGALSLKENMLLGIFLIFAGLFLLKMSIISFKKIYLTKINKE
ncbi:MAG: hypothetical protein J6D28_00335 [Bacilli bacterium]|nr:hypothetical protein [Bacilli bacterium]